ncbi:DEAD/DEAH box helicase [Blochmannia endosymbiont of Colobopsis nipponica]|uniref:DEAD/DEAH box helicase n=1 Tax=Blochmannia endosymbiont of Colobopsis nipponica TaxID=2681987 RepID=UPI0017830DA0|nr:DEAD/DEAH box helicase [Blochmannia endosymbiont of Colobopsis nipponica]QOI11297.1 DEAD/DEAH box helicase [Blochmannia endosymbiont of Colobopsis nipponica]
MLIKNSSFINLGLNSFIINALKDLGYKEPSPIQAKCIPHLLAGLDVLGMAQTGSGKTAAFVLPLLQNVDSKLMATQVLVLTPTRELAIQISTVCSSLAKYLPDIYIVPIYGGQRYDIQFRALNKGAHIIVGTPGRLLDHLGRGTLDLTKLHSLVLDEADEMLRMGFIDDVESILLKIPVKHQTALFSATLPSAIRRIVHRFMKNPKEIFIHSGTSACSDIKQYYCLMYGIHKSEALMRFIEIENFDAVIVFVRTKSSSVEVTEILEKNGYNSAALNGDMSQTLRQQTLNRFKSGKFDILIATDIAARGLDVDRVSLVINYDVPLDAESYVHRIGRTGRAGRVGQSLLFVGRSEYKLLRNIERVINSVITEISLPSFDVLIARRLEKFSAQLELQLKHNDLDIYLKLLAKIRSKIDYLDTERLAAILLRMVQGSKRLASYFNPSVKHFVSTRNRSKRDVHGRNFAYCEKKGTLSNIYNKYQFGEMGLYRIELGRNHGIKISHIVGAINNNKGNINCCIGAIRLFASYSTIELPKIVSPKILSVFNRIRILNKPINIQFIGNVFRNSNI